MEKQDPKVLIRTYYQNVVKLKAMLDKEQAKVVTAAEVMGWTPEETNEILGANVMTEIPNPEPKDMEKAEKKPD